MLLQEILNDNKAITMVESIVVTSIIGVLVLLGGMAMNKYVDKTKKTQFIYDSKIAEDASTIYYVFNEKLPIEGIKPIDKDLFKEIVDMGIVYNKEGLVKDPEKYIEKDYYFLAVDFIEEEVRSKLDGRFLVTDECEIMYLDNKEQEHENLIRMAVTGSY